ncbi:hypothetical protein BT69DRAFT_1214722 [Atractiella rhizophila]|nr:hypothetical protein BT69DRAFT_1214722 [Atractiella rhizophila]
MRRRKIYWPFSYYPPPPDPVPSTPENLAKSAVLPLFDASVLSRLTFQWITPLMALGYLRTLQASDLYKLAKDASEKDMTSGYLATRLLEAFEEKERRVEQWNTALAEGTLSSSTILWARFKLFFLPWKRTDKYKKEKKDRKHPLEYLEREADLVAALNDVFWWRWWSGGCLKVIGDTLQTTSPLVSKRIIQFAQKSYIAHRTGVEGPPIGHGIGWAFLLFFMQLGASVCMHHMLYRSMECGTLARGALISAIYRRAMVLSGKARITLNNGRLVNHISTDVSRIDFAAGFFHMVCPSSLLRRLAI